MENQALQLKTLAVALSIVSFSAQAASFSLSGDYRFGANLFQNLDVSAGQRPGTGDTTAFIDNRFRLRPDVIVDDRFSIRSELVALVLGGASPVTGPQAAGSPLDSQSHVLNGRSAVDLRRVWLEWASDWGIFRAGRMPKTWGLGVLYHPGNDVADDFGTTVDRLGFQAMLGNLGLNLGYEKEAEGSVNDEGDDAETYEISLDYSNPESLFDVGLLFARRVRNVGAKTVLGLDDQNDLSIFARRRFGAFQLGGEFVTVSEEGKNSTQGVLAQIDYMPGAWRFNTDLAFASGNSTGSFRFHPNYRPLMLLYRQSIGPAAPASEWRGGVAGVPVGSAIGGGSGAVLNTWGMAYDFVNTKISLGMDIGYGLLANKGTAAGKLLGVETDIYMDQHWYENFKTNVGLGLLFPGAGFGAASQTAWGFQVRGALSF